MPLRWSHAGGIYSMAISPDGHTLVSGGVDQVLKIWNCTPANWFAHFPGTPTQSIPLSLAPMGNCLLVAVMTELLKSGNWQPGNGCEFFQDIRVLSLCCHPNAQILVSGMLKRPSKFGKLQPSIAVMNGK